MLRTSRISNALSQNGSDGLQKIVHRKRLYRMIDARYRLLTLAAQPENSRVIVSSDLLYECSLIGPRERMADDHQIETVIATVSSRLGKT